MENIAYKYRIYPTTEQRILFAKTFGCCRKVYNLMLADKIKHYEETGKNLMTTPAMYKKEYPFLKEVDSLALANVQLNLQTAYKNFFRDKRIGFPKFKSSKHSRKSYTTNNQNGTVALCGSYIKLPKVGLVKAKLHRLPKASWLLKSATVSQDGDGKYYISILFAYEGSNVSPSTGTMAIGLDYSSSHLFIDSNGKGGSDFKPFKQSQKKLAKAQRKLSRMQGSKKGESKSSNFRKQLNRINRIHRHASNQRKDILHKLSAEIANQYDIVCVESLNMKSMSNKGFGNGKATMDNGYGLFLNMLDYKLRNRGKVLVKVDKWYPSSQICSRCNSRHQLSLSERTYICPNCGAVIDRDHNAAINIKNEGLRILSEGIVA